MKKKNITFISLNYAPEDSAIGLYSSQWVEFIELNGTELLEELKNKQGELTNKLIEEYVCFFPTLLGRKQVGKSSFYSRRTPKDSEIDINKSIDEQFDLLRIVDNEKYPAFFIKNNVKYILKIFKENE